MRRLAQVAGTPGAGAVTFDAADNLTGKANTGTASYDSVGQLLRRTAPNGATTDFTYDGRGNRTARTPTATPDQAITYGYDTADRLTNHQAPAGTTAYRYDGDGLLATSTRTAGTTTTNLTFTWDVGAVTGALPMLLSDGVLNYLYGPDGHPYAQISRGTGAISYLHADLIGSTRAITDTAGAVTGASIYSPYGSRTKIGTGTATSPFGYAGEYTDAAGLTYLRSRHYDPDAGTFLTRDPLVAETGAPHGYADGNPVTNTDPSGLCLGFGNGGCPGSDQLCDALQTRVGRAATSTLVGIGDGFTGGITKGIRESISLGSSCTVDHNGFYYAGMRIGTAATALSAGGAAAAGAAGGAQSAFNGARLGKHLTELAKYGKAGSRELESGRIRYYWTISPARNPGEMAARRVVREWDPATGSTRTWHETVDGEGRIRQIRPQTSGSKKHDTFKENGNYTGSW